MSIDAFILIGGRSSRFGSDKAIAGFGGETLAARAARAVADAGVFSSITFVAASANQLGSVGSQLDYPIVSDLVPGRGPVGGLNTALAYAKTDNILLLACDMPIVSPEILALIVDKISGDHGAVIPEQPDGIPQPLSAIYERKIATAVTENLLHRRASVSMRDVIREVQPRIVKFEEYAYLPGANTFFSNVNTQGELDTISAEL